MKTEFSSGNIVVSKSGTTSTVLTPTKTTGIYVNSGVPVQLRNNFLGGVDVSVDGEIFYLKTADANADTTSWTQKVGSGANQQTLTLWNAGIGGRDGLMTDQHGQVYHKIVGFNQYSGTAGTTQGHSIIGNQTSDANIAKLPRVINYDGYYYANVVSAANNGKPAYATGQLSIAADFDAETIRGTSKSVEVRESGSLGPINYGDKMSFSGTISGATYTGQMTSSYGQLDGADISGAFYGGGAQETAGIITKQGAGLAIEGYFTATD